MEQELAPSIFDELIEQPYYEYASQGQRLANYFIDVVVFFVFNYGFFYVFGVVLVLCGLSQQEIYEVGTNKLLMYGIVFFNMAFFYTIVEGVTRGKSLGKLITRTRAVQEDLKPLTWKLALLRSLSRIVPFEPFSGVGGTPWHDKWTRTTVIRNRVE
ncbi:MAG: RDD family protein [Bacteroidota bacterium]